MEDLDLGIRQSVRAAGVTEQGFDKAQDVVSDKLNEAMDALRVNRDADAADRLLQQVANEKLPKESEAYRWLVVSQVQMQRNQWEEALKSCNRANEYRREFPILDLLRGICYNALGKGKEALKHLEAYRDLLGEDGLVCRNSGDALRSMQHFAEARDAYRRALDFDPRNVDAFLGLLRSLTYTDNRDDLGKRFAKDR